jgi:hypothetical protein
VCPRYGPIPCPGLPAVPASWAGRSPAGTPE